MPSLPVVVSENLDGRTLARVDRHGQYNEAWLQELLRQQPDLLPVAEIESIFEPLVPIRREVPTASRIIDNLYVSRVGYPVMAATKVWRNPEAKPEVVAQAIDYGSAIAQWGDEQLDQAARHYTRQYAASELGLRDWVESYLDAKVEGGTAFFEDMTSHNLRLGRFLTLIVGDQIRESLVEMLGYVNLASSACHSL